MTSKVEMISVIIPTLNEAGNILEALITVNKELAYPKEIIVVDGDSTDGTKEIVKDTNCRLIIEPKRGYGYALRTGMKHAKGDIILIIGPTTGVIEYTVGEIRVDLKNVEKAQKGVSFSIPVDEIVRRSDKLYKVIDAKEAVTQ